MSAIPLLTDINQYNRAINIGPPRLPHFDIRSFERNMESVRLRMPPFRIGFFQIALLEAGGGHVNSDGSDYDLDNCTLFFNLPGQIIFWEIPRDWQGYYCCIDESFYTVQPDGFTRLFDYPFFQGYTPGVHLRREEADEVLHQLGRIHRAYTRRDTYRELTLKTELALLLIHCLHYHQRQQDDRRARHDKERLSSRFKLVVHEHLTGLRLGSNRQALSVKDCAAQLFVTPQYLAEVIRRELDTTPTAYLNRCLVQEARKLLRATPLSVGEIATQLGFSSNAYFSRLFSKYTGCSPTQYRK